eukprot:13707861-Alexandrium_andersonii.AAC.1
MAGSRDWGPFEEGPLSFQDRHPSLNGRLLNDKARSTYVLRENATLGFFKPSDSDDTGGTGNNNNSCARGERLLRRHSLNNRDQQDTRNKYKQLLFERGIMKGARNESIAVPSSCEQQFQASMTQNGIIYINAEFAGGAHLVEAAYEAHAEQPNNCQVQISIKSGLPGVTLLDPRTPRDALEYFIKEANFWNKIKGDI